MPAADKWIFPVTLAALLGCGLMAGVFFAFSAFVMKALGRLPAHEGIAAMQSINIVVLNPLFLMVFMGTAVACLGTLIHSLLHRHDSGAAYRIVGSALYLLGTFLVTAAFNVPLNDALATVKPASHEGATIWANYLTTWMVWNHVRTVAALGATASFALALYARTAAG